MSIIFILLGLIACIILYFCTNHWIFIVFAIIFGILSGYTYFYPTKMRGGSKNNSSILSSPSIGSISKAGIPRYLYPANINNTIDYDESTTSNISNNDDNISITSNVSNNPDEDIYGMSYDEHLTYVDETLKEQNNDNTDIFYSNDEKESIWEKISNWWYNWLYNANEKKAYTEYRKHNPNSNITEEEYLDNPNIDPDGKIKYNI